MITKERKIKKKRQISGWEIIFFLFISIFEKLFKNLKIRRKQNNEKWKVLKKLLRINYKFSFFSLS